MLAATRSFVLALGVVGLLSACPDKEDPEALIRRAIESAAAAAEKKDTAGVMEIISENVKARGMDYQEIKRMVFGQLRVGSWQKVLLVRTVVALESETTAKAETTVVLARGATTSLEDALNTNSGTYRFELDFSKEDDGWKVVNIEYRSASLENVIGVE
jgi:ketosteroid isomerase-like protein